MFATAICQEITILLNFIYLEEYRAFGPRRRLCAGRSQGSNSGKSECFLCTPKRPDWFCGPHNLLFNIYWSSSLGIKRSGRETNESRASSAEVMMFSTIAPFFLSFQLNEQQ